jgi:hypothetical protein
MQRVMAAAAYADETSSPYSGGETAETLIALGASRDELDELADAADGYGTAEWVAQFRASARTVARPEHDGASAHLDEAAS